MKANRDDIEGAADAFMQWTKAGGKELTGLVKRRRDERALFLR
jgi:lysozyme